MKRNKKEVPRVKVTKETLIGEILELDIELGRFLLEMGMHCLGCPSARSESLEMACAVHGTDADERFSCRKGTAVKSLRAQKSFLRPFFLVCDSAKIWRHPHVRKTSAVK